MSGIRFVLFVCILICGHYMIQGEDVPMKNSPNANSNANKPIFLGEISPNQGNITKPQPKTKLDEIKPLHYDINTLGEPAIQPLNLENNLNSTISGHHGDQGNDTAIKISFDLGDNTPYGTVTSAENDPPTDGKVTVFKLDSDMGKGHLLIGNLTAKDPLDSDVAKGNFTSFTLVNNLPIPIVNTTGNNMETNPAVIHTEGTAADIMVGNDKGINNSSLKYSTLVKTISSPHMQAAKKVNILSRNMRMRSNLGRGENINPFMKMNNHNREHHDQFLNRHHHSSKHNHPHNKRIIMDAKEEIMLKPFDLKPRRESHVIDMNIIVKNPKMHFSSSPFADNNMNNNPLDMPPLMNMFNYANMLLQDMDPHNIPPLPVGFGSQEFTYVFRKPQQSSPQSKLESILRSNPFSPETPFFLNNNEQQQHQAQQFDFMSPLVPDINCPIHGIQNGIHRHMMGICTCDNHFVK